MSVLDKLGRSVVEPEAVDFQDQPSERPGEVHSGDECVAVPDLMLADGRRQAAAEKQAQHLCLRVAVHAARQPGCQRPFDCRHARPATVTGATEYGLKQQHSRLLAQQGVIDEAPEPVRLERAGAGEVDDRPGNRRERERTPPAGVAGQEMPGGMDTHESRGPVTARVRHGNFEARLGPRAEVQITDAGGGPERKDGPGPASQAGSQRLSVPALGHAREPKHLCITPHQETRPDLPLDPAPRGTRREDLTSGDHAVLRPGEALYPAVQLL
jgi:hypothetical protein